MGNANVGGIVRARIDNKLHVGGSEALCSDFRATFGLYLDADDVHVDSAIARRDGASLTKRQERWIAAWTAGYYAAWSVATR